MEITDRNKLLKKVKITYSIELGIFAILFAVLGSLVLSGVISVADWKRYVFTYVTLFGGAWLIVDFIWMLRSPKRRARNSLFDKIIVLPIAVAVLVFDIVMLSLGLVHIPEGATTHPAFAYFIGADFLYLSLVYLAQIIYHWKYPLPSLIEAIDEALEQERKDNEEEARKAQEAEENQQAEETEEKTPSEDK